MGFCWRTSSIGYPNFFAAEGKGAELASAFMVFADAAVTGVPYSQAKALTGVSGHQAETKKAAFQEYGLLYVVPRSDALTLTPLGLQLYNLVKKGIDHDSRRIVLAALARGLARSQLSNPLPVGGRQALSEAPVDVLPYLACYFLLHKLDGVLTKSELRGHVFGIERMSDLAASVDAIRHRRTLGEPFPDLDALPPDAGTRENLRIYFVSHLGLDAQILHANYHPALYGGEDPAYELSELGYETTAAVLDLEWPTWREAGAVPPQGRVFASVDDYFINGVGNAFPAELDELELSYGEKESGIATDGLVSPDELDSELPRKQYVEARQRLSEHKRLEKTRNPALVRDAKDAFRQKHGSLWCEVCGFDYGATYGERGLGYIHAHHLRPVAEIEPETTLTIDDLAMVCANCHGMLHKAPWIGVQELKATYRAQRPKGE
ncbi:MAG TPA: HNH endonuclease [Coriobacteriia bacterium]